MLFVRHEGGYHERLRWNPGSTLNFDKHDIHLCAVPTEVAQPFSLSKGRYPRAEPSSVLQRKPP